MPSSCTLRDNILKFDRAVPRYTSYPTAPHFKTLDRQETYLDWLHTLPQQANLSLYLHVPFCPQLCWYCGCNTKITQRYAPVENYAYIIMREIDTLAELLPAGHHVKNIHWGGGSPGMLSAHDFEKIVERLQDAFRIDESAEVAIELDPRGVTEGRVATYARAGINRVSLGVQDFHMKTLNAINRPQPFHLTYKAMKLFREYGIENINFDLLYGLPHQTVESIQEAMKTVVALRPSRIAYFGYAHVPWVKKHMRLIDETALPDKELRLDLFNAGAEILKTAGYQAVGIDHFAVPEDGLAIAARNGRLHRNFQGYTADATDALIGIGASSISKLPQGYAQNAVDMPVYEGKVLDGALPVQKYYPVTEADRLRGVIIERLMCDFTADIGAICRGYGFAEDYLDAEIAALSAYKEAEFIDVTVRVVTVRSNTKPMARLVCSVFDSYLVADSATPKHARAV